MVVDVFVPRQGLRSMIAPGSGVVAAPPYPDVQTGLVLVDFEGNLYGASNVRTFADRVAQAAGRHLERYPTVARIAVHPNKLTHVGTFDTEEGVVRLLDGMEPELREWLGLEYLLAEDSTELAAS